MPEVISLLLGISLIIFFGAFAEFIFKRFSIPDVLFLIVLGFLLGPNVLGYVTGTGIQSFAPLFTTFTLLFLLFDGAFNIHLSSLLREFSSSLTLTLFNFLISSAIVFLIMLISGQTMLLSLFTGFLLGGVSSSFVIPILNQVKVKEKIYSLLTLESALTDVFCIVFALGVIEILKIGAFGIKSTFAQLASLFAVAGLIGLLAGVVWIVIVVKIFKEPHYMITIAFLVLVYVLTEFLQGNGAIAALFFGLMLKNSKSLISILIGIKSKKSTDKKKAINGELGISVITPSEVFFYHQISFLLKTFFFVYIGILIDISDYKALILGGIISLLLMFSRTASLLLTKQMETSHRSLVNSMFARGLAAAAIVQVALQMGVPNADFIAKVTYVVITGTIVLSSIRVFFVKRKLPKPKLPKVKKTKEDLKQLRVKRALL
jgi:potassium/hydrogen antiporter